MIAALDEIRLHAAIHHRELDGEFAIYHEESGNTVLLCRMAACLFSALLQGGPRTKSRLASEIGATPSDPGTHDSFEASLDFLQDLGCISIGPSR
jgi:hypothetical protein